MNFVKYVNFVKNGLLRRDFGINAVLKMRFWYKNVILKIRFLLKKKCKSKNANLEFGEKWVSET